MWSGDIKMQEPQIIYDSEVHLTSQYGSTIVPQKKSMQKETTSSQISKIPEITTYGKVLLFETINFLFISRYATK